MMIRRTIHGLGGCLVLSVALGCAAEPDFLLVDAYYSGNHGQARQYLKKRVANHGAPLASATPDQPDRDYTLDRMRLGLVTLADGYAPAFGAAWDHVYHILRKASLNQHMEVAAVILNEDLKIWKGEPFEQALAYHYIGLHYATQGSWDNARAAFLNSLFPLKAVVPGQHLSPEQVMERSQGQDESFFDHPQEEKTNFTLGYFMRAVAAQQLAMETGDPDRVQEARENFAEALALEPQLAELVSRFNPGRYNTVLVVDFGRGPGKIGTGPDDAIATFQPITSSSGARLIVTHGRETSVHPAVCDVNLMARDHMWNNLQDMRTAKSILGTGLMMAGTGVAAAGNHRDATITGLSMLTLGAFLRAGAHADTRYCELIPQRIYVVPLMIERASPSVLLQVEGSPVSRMVLSGLSPPQGITAQLRFVRLLSPAYGWESEGWSSSVWAASGYVRYANDHLPDAGRIRLPYILGGDCVRTPSEQTLASYQQAGFLRELTVSDLRELYRAEGITWTFQDAGGTPGLHVLEGGKTLVAPLPGSAGFARLFGMEHPPYQPASKLVREWRARLHPQLESMAIGPPSRN